MRTVALLLIVLGLAGAVGGALHGVSNLAGLLAVAAGLALLLSPTDSSSKEHS